MLLWFTPLLEVAVTRAPFRKLSRHHPPLAAALEHIRHAAKDLIQIHLTGTGLLPGAFQDGHNLFECLSTDITRVALAHPLSFLKTNSYTRNYAKDYEQALTERSGMEIQGCAGMPEETFRRLTGVRKRTFAEMVTVLESAEAALKKQGGKPNRLTVETRLRMTLEYWREYQRSLHIGYSYGGEYGVSHDPVV